MPDNEINLSIAADRTKDGNLTLVVSTEDESVKITLEAKPGSDPDVVEAVVGHFPTAVVAGILAMKAKGEPEDG